MQSGRWSMADDRWLRGDWDWECWREQVRRSPTGMGGLRRLPGIDRSRAEDLGNVVDRYPFRATPYYLSLIDWENENDPVRMQCLPDVREVDWVDGGGLPGWEPDPFAETRRMPVPGLVHRFPDRALVIACAACAVNCRHCTRKNTLACIADDIDDGYLGPIVRYISGDRRIREVIVSGGDPLLLDDGVLDGLLGALGAIDHVEVLRLGTRVPAVLPMRIDEDLCDMLAAHRPLWVNTQFNHPAELTDEAVRACDMLVRRGMPVSNQCVLLRGINDSVEVMRDLCNGLQRNLVRPYYVLQCDPVAGTEHFGTDLSVGGNMSRELRRQVGGLSLPRFVADVPGEAGKVPLR